MTRIFKSTVFVLLTFLAVNTSAYSGWFSKDLPVAVTFRKAIGGDSLVAKFTNTSVDQYLAVKVTYSNKSFKDRQAVQIKLGPKQSTERGWAEGWSFQSGETITLESDGYGTMTVTVP